jgi:hypothetical protein
MYRQPVKTRYAIASPLITSDTADVSFARFSVSDISPQVTVVFFTSL